MPVMSDILASVVEGRSAYDGGSVVSIMYGDAPGLAAHLAVLDVVLRVAAAGVEADRVGLAAVGTRHDAARVGRSVAEWELPVEIELVGLVVALIVESKAHRRNLQRDTSGGLTI